MLTALNFSLLLFTVITAGLHDIANVRATKKLLQRNADDREKVTILVPAHNEALVIERCLRSILRLDYRHYSVIVINDGSTDATSELAQKFITDHGMQAKVVDIYPNKGKGAALQHILDTETVEDICMVLDADCTIAPDGLRTMVAQFKNPQVMAANANVRINEEHSLSSYFQQIEYIVGYYHKRHNAYSNSEFIIGGQGATYRLSAIKMAGGIRSGMQTEDIDLSMRIAALGNKEHRLVYSPDTIIYTESVPTLQGLYRQRYRWKFGAQQAIYANKHLVLSRTNKHSKLLTWFRLPQSIFGELRLFFDISLLLFFIGIAVYTRSLWIFFGSWFSVTFYNGAVIAADQHTLPIMKLKLLAINVLLFPLHIGMMVLNFVAAAQMIRNWQQLIGRKELQGSWVPPDRIGKRQLG